jgi:hypothetical protein
VNPAFMPELERAVSRALDDAGEEIRTKAQANARWSRTIPPNIIKEPVRIDAGSPTVVVRLRREGFKGQFFEGGTKPRYQRKTGRFTGRAPARPFMGPARDEVVRKGLDLHRYL